MDVMYVRTLSVFIGVLGVQIAFTMEDLDNGRKEKSLGFKNNRGNKIGGTSTFLNTESFSSIQGLS